MFRNVGFLFSKSKRKRKCNFNLSLHFGNNSRFWFHQFYLYFRYILERLLLASVLGLNLFSSSTLISVPDTSDEQKQNCSYTIPDNMYKMGLKCTALSSPSSFLPCTSNSREAFCYKDLLSSATLFFFSNSFKVFVYDR